MIENEKDINLVLIGENPGCANTIREILQVAGISGIIRRVTPGERAVECARRKGSYQSADSPDLILFDYEVPDKDKTTVLNEIAFCPDRASIPVVLLTSPESQKMINDGDVGDDKAVMFTPTSLTSFVDKMRNGQREVFLKAVRTLYEYGPILVSMPRHVAH
ncbi:MAG: hypothetical protein QNJ11_06950 [Woeseiaceae bacterium]|nr:hypothetical protein [Woeseiaceae bacterium]